MKSTTLASAFVGAVVEITASRAQRRGSLYCCELLRNIQCRSNRSSRLHLAFFCRRRNARRKSYGTTAVGAEFRERSLCYCSCYGITQGTDQCQGNAYHIDFGERCTTKECPTDQYNRQTTNGIACPVGDGLDQFHKHERQYIFHMIRSTGQNTKPNRW